MKQHHEFNKQHNPPPPMSVSGALSQRLYGNKNKGPYVFSWGVFFKPPPRDYLGNKPKQLMPSDHLHKSLTSWSVFPSNSDVI